MDYRPSKIAESSLLKDSVLPVQKSISACGHNRRLRKRKEKKKKRKLQETVQWEVDNNLLPIVLHTWEAVF